MNDRDPREDDWIFDESLASLARRARREIREEAQEIESIVADAELREATMADIARQARNRGDFVGLATGRRTFNGWITFVGRDFITIRTDSFEADINLADTVYLRTIDRSHAGGQPTGDGAGTFEMRLVERKSPRERVELGYSAIEETVIGNISAVGQDHIVMVDDHAMTWHIPLTAISYVIRRGRRMR